MKKMTSALHAQLYKDAPEKELKQRLGLLESVVNIANDENHISVVTGERVHSEMAYSSIIMLCKDMKKIAKRCMKFHNVRREK